MDYEHILCGTREGVTTICLNHPDKLNALDARMSWDLARALDAAGQDDAVKVLVITGAGRGFCSGADLATTFRATDPKLSGVTRPTRLEPFVSFGAVVKRLHTFHKPLLCAINGVAAGAGLSLACLCDIRIASEKARLSSIFVKRGLVADSGISYRLPRMIGTERALELMWTGEMLDAGRALEMGLVSRVVPHDTLMEVTGALALKIARGPSTSIELMKRMVYEGLEANNFALQIAYEAWAQEMCHLTEDCKEGVDAFLEKREARFTGN